MAEEKNDSEEKVGSQASKSSSPTFDLADEVDIPTVFSNNSFVDLNNMDISVLFLNDASSMHGRRSRPVRVAFSHAGFVQMVRFLQRYADFVENVYGGAVPSFSTVNQELLRRELDTLLNMEPEDNSAEDIGDK